MPANRFLILLLIALVCHACIEPFDPVIRETQELMVIDGMITDRAGIQKVTISLSAPYGDPEFEPVSGCVVTVTDNLGNVEFYTEDPGQQGVYEANLDEPFLGVGKIYSLQVVTPEYQTYVSDYDTLLACPPIDSVYFIKKVTGGEDPEDVWNGVQFYNDVRGNPGGTRNYRWKATATWEYRSPSAYNYIWYKGTVLPNLDDSVHYCWYTETIQTVFAASTKLLSENSIYKNKLHYVSDQSPRLVERYSLLVEQYSLTDQAYAYWEKLAAQSSNAASLYETQPSSSQGNIYNTNRPDEKVLGYFYATQPMEHRIFVDKEDLDFPVSGYKCRLDTLYTNESFNFDNYYFLYSLNPMGPGPPWLGGEKECFDCTERGGDNEEPDFW